MKFEIGATVGGYEFLSVLETSPTGITYKVRNVVVKRLESLKVLPKEFQEDQQRVDRFLREVNIRARLSHPNIVTFYNAMPLDGQLVMTTELIEGSALEELMTLGPLTAKECVDYMCQALSALVYAHAHGVVHRNITPASMIITEEGKLKLGDFGLAKMYADPSLTRTGTVMGSVYYAAPEQVKGVTTLDERTDIYSIGVVLYELVTREKPFSSKSQFEVMQAHVEKAPAPPQELNKEISPELNQIILTALAKQPQKRFSSAMRFRAALMDAPLSAAETSSARRRTGLLPVRSADESVPQSSSESAEAVSQGLRAKQPAPRKQAAAAQSTMKVSQMRKVSGKKQPAKLPDLPIRPALPREPEPRPKDPDLLLVGALTFVGVALIFFAFLTLID